MKDDRPALRTFGVTSMALVMVMLDNLVVSTALNVIRQELGATLEQLEWTVNAYTLTFAVLLLTGAALGDRFGRRRVFIIGVADLHRRVRRRARCHVSIETLIIARAAQGVGGAIVTPLTLTLLSPRSRRSVAASRSAAWGAVGGLAIAIGPLVGGAIVGGLDWNWIFWINVPIGIALIPLAWFGLRESHGPASRLDLRGVVLASAGLLGIVWALINGNSEGWTSPVIVAPSRSGPRSWSVFVVWERRAPAPMLPLRFFASRTFSFANALRPAHELRDVRRHLPAGPVPPVRARLLPARGGRCHPALDVGPDVRGAPSRAHCRTASAVGSSWAWG